MEARYSIESPRRIALRFQAGGISHVNISSFTETLIAPALVGRNFISHQLLLALQEVRLLDLLGFVSCDTSCCQGLQSVGGGKSGQIAAVPARV